MTDSILYLKIDMHSRVFFLHYTSTTQKPHITIALTQRLGFFGCSVQN